MAGGQRQAETLPQAWSGLNHPKGGFKTLIKDLWVEAGGQDQRQAILGAYPGWMEKRAWQDWGAWGSAPWGGQGCWASLPDPTSPAAFLFSCSRACLLLRGLHRPMTHTSPAARHAVNPCTPAPQPPAVRGGCPGCLQLEGRGAMGPHRGTTPNPSLPTGHREAQPPPFPAAGLL